MNVKLILAVLILIGAVAIGVTDISKRQDKLEFNEVQLKSRAVEIKKLKTDYDILNVKYDEAKGDQEKLKQLEVEREELKKREADLEAQLQAKRNEKARIAAAASKVAQTASFTATASAAPRVSGSCADIQGKLAALGVPQDQLAAAGTLAMRESTCNEFVVNSIGACGAFQSLPCGKWGSPGTTQYYQGAINYANNRYGGFNGALAHSYSHNWY